ncbi:MAG: deoxyribose-phosphate aldolase [Candidatus Zixiibacteriota bacterium]
MNENVKNREITEVLDDIRQEMGDTFLGKYIIHDFAGDFEVIKLEDPSEIAEYIDHTLLDPAADATQIREFCRGALEFKFASICVNPNNVKAAFDIVASSGMEVCSVVGFPLGAHHAVIKAHEAELAIYDGASEIDMVIDIGALKSRHFSIVYHDIYEVATVCENQSATLKVIIETCKLNKHEKIAACLLSLAAGADYVKTSTGMGGGGATEEDITLMRQVVGPKLGVKASGGIRNLESAMAMLKAGATRIGAGAGDNIAKEGQI